MSIVRKIRSARERRRHRGSNELARAVATAPTRASREELLYLVNMGR